MLDSHPNIACGPEFKLIPAIASLWADTVTAYADILQAYQLTISDVNAAYRQLIETLLSNYQAASKKPRLAEKSPNNVFFLPHLNQIFPDSPLIHVIRDGRDVVSSLLTMNWVDITTNEKLPYVESAQGAAEYWVNTITAARTAASEPAIREHYLEIRYEELVRQPQETLVRLLDYIGEPWDPAVLEYHRIERDLAGESSAERVSGELDTTAVGRWQKDLTGADRDTVKRIAGNLLIELGYAEDNDW